MPEYRLRHNDMAPGRARVLAHEAVSGVLSRDRADDFVLMVSEVVANAVRHAPPERDGNVVLRLEVGEAAVRAIVMDGGQEFEFDRATFDPRTNHYGLEIVDHASSRWGLSLDGEKAVWFEVDLEK